MAKFDRLYKHSPLWLQNAMVSTYGLYWHWARFGGNYKQHEAEFQAREWYSQTDWNTYQCAQLRNLLTYCAREVPFYRNHWNQDALVALEDGDLSRLPLLEKESLRSEPSAFFRQDFKPFPKFTFHTSGTTGTPIESVFSLSELRNSMALRETRSANWAGVSFKDARATFSGRMVEPDPQQDSTIYRYNSVEKQVYFSAFHLKPATALRYVDALFKHKVVWMTGYAVSFYLLANYILDQNLEVPPLSAIITTSEKLTSEMRQIMQRAFQCRVYEEYSTVENCLFASECEQGRLHLSPDVGYVEILRPDGSPCPPGEIGEVVTTCLTRNFQPLVRFRLGDLAAWETEPCPCGRQMPILREVVGRIEDVITGPDGRQMVRFHGIFVDQPHILEGQIIQESYSAFTVKVVPSSGFSKSDESEIRHRMQQRLGYDVEIKVEQVEQIPRTSSGKFRAVISKVKK